MNFRYQIYGVSVAALALLCGCGAPEAPKANPPVTPPATTTPAPTSAPTPKESAGGDPAPKVDPKAGPKAEAPKPDTTAASGEKETPKGETRTVTLDAHSLAMPATWKEVPPANKMRKYQASVPKAAGDAEDAEFVVAPPMGGGLDANINRWANQFGGANSLVAKREIKTASGGTATVVELQGPYSAMTMQGPQPPKDGYAQLGAIVTTAEGDFFLKLIGPKKTIEQNKLAFDAMVGSFK